MKAKLLLIFLLLSIIGYSQEKEIDSFCKEEIKKLNEQYILLESDYKNAIAVLDTLKKELNVSITDKLFNQIKEADKLKSNVKDSLFKVVSRFKSFEAVCELSEDDLKQLFDHPKMDEFLKEDQSTELDEEENTEVQTYIYFNEDQIIKEDIIKNEGIEGRILNNIISQTNQESYLGDITIPKEGEQFFFYKRISKKKWKERMEAEKQEDSGDGGAEEMGVKLSENYSENYYMSNKLNTSNTSEILGTISYNEFEKVDEKFKFKSIDVQIKDGNFYDIRLKISHNNQIYLFENTTSVSFFRYNRMARDNYLVYAQKQPFKIEDNISEIQEYRIRLSDVLYYEYKIGNNYIPSDLVLELPKNDIDGNQTNLESPATYQIKEDTYLDKIIELRAYTDFFAMFGEADNGLLQIEGSAKFYLYPFSRPIFKIAQFELFKSLTPYVNYARFEEGDQLVQALPAEVDPLTNPGTFDKKLDIIEKRFLTMGLNLNVFEIYNKKYPVKASLFASADYNITEAQNDMIEPENIRSLGVGFGVNISSQRFNNFGFNYNLGLNWYDLKSFNDSDSFDTNFTVPVFKNEAEVFYHPTDNPNQAIFVRLRTFNYKGNSSSEAFYQFQFGYKFSLGSRKVKKQN